MTDDKNVLTIERRIDMAVEMARMRGDMIMLRKAIDHFDRLELRARRGVWLASGVAIGATGLAGIAWWVLLRLQELHTLLR